MAICGLLVWTGVDQAAGQTWSGLAADDNWGTPGNWVNNTPPATGAAVTFGSSSDLTSNLQAPYDIQSLTFSSGAEAYTFTGSTLTLQPTTKPPITTIVNDSSSNQTFDNAVVFNRLGSSITAATGAGSLNFDGGLTIEGGPLTTNAVTSASSVTLTNTSLYLL